MRTFILMIYFLCLTAAATKECKINEYNFGEFAPETFLENCNWFDLKFAYYKSVNANANSTATLNMAEALTILGEFRLITLKEHMKLVFGPNETVCEEVNGLAEQYEPEVAKLKLRDDITTWYFKCTKFFYVVTSFGSQTLTSDFDFSVYRILQRVRAVTADDELSSIRNITKKLHDLDNSITNLVCHGDSMQMCFDSNGYPEIMVYYNNYFLNIKVNTKEEMNDVRYANVVSSKIIRYCIVSQIYFAKVVEKMNQSYFRQRFFLLFTDCFNKMSEATRDFVTLNEFEFDLAPEEVILDRPYKSRKMKKMTKVGGVGHHYRMTAVKDIGSDFFENLKSYNVPTRGEQRDYVLNAYKILNYFVQDVDDEKKQFLECINNIPTPNFFVEKLYGKSRQKIIEQYRTSNVENVRIMTHQNMKYTVYDELFYLPDSYQRNRTPLINHMVMPFIGACHIWADEAYVTFGALEFVKREKQILLPDNVDYLRCDSLIETFFENMGMMMYHMYEEAHNGGYMDDKVKNHQSISDAYSKYLRRSLIAVSLPCLNDFGVTFKTFRKKSKVLNKLKKSIIYQFYLKIKKVELNGDKKKNYFIIFKKVFGAKYTIKKLIVETMDYYIRLSKSLLFLYNKEKLFKKPVRMRERVLVD